MADEAISQLATFPTTATTATGTSANQVEILDVNDTSMASSGTNKRVNMADFFSTFVTAGSNITVTKQTAGGGVIVAGAAGLAVGSAISGGSNNATLVEDGSGNLKALAVGSSGQHLTVASGAAFMGGSANKNLYFFCSEHFVYPNDVLWQCDWAVSVFAICWNLSYFWIR